MANQELNLEPLEGEIIVVDLGGAELRLVISELEEILSEPFPGTPTQLAPADVVALQVNSMR